jgi:short-subunit dehydrogenase
VAPERTALVTGASSGIGRAFAEALAARGHPVVLVARDAERLRGLAARLPGRGHEVLAADLATPAGRAAVEARLDDDRRPVALLVNAAGVGTADAFPRAALEAEEAQLEVNVRAVLRLCWRASRAMTRRGDGAIVNVASTAAIWSAGTYAGSKAWVVMATDALRDALAGTPVRVLCVIPGFTRSEFHARAGVDPSGVPGWLWLTPATVAREALAALAAGRGTCVPGRRYRALLAVLGPLPPRLRRAALRRVARLQPARAIRG